MALLDITEYTRLAVDASGNPLPTGREPGKNQQVTFTGTAAASAAFTGNFIRIHSDAACRILFGADPTAVATSPRLAAGATEFFGVKPGDKVSAITTT